MGLFGAIDPSPDMLARLANEDRYSRKWLAREEDGVRAALGPWERVLIFGCDVRGSAGITAVTSERVFQLKRRRVTMSATWDRLHGTRLLVTPNGQYLATIDGPGLHLVTFYTSKDANRFVGMIDFVLTRGVPGSRDIPVLFPSFYERVLHILGKPTTEYNIAQLVVRVADMIKAGGANAYFEQTDAGNARTAFNARFHSVNDDMNVLMRLPDDMIDFLWAWSPGCHISLHKLVDRVFELFTMPQSPLWRDGDAITPWGEGD